MVVIPPKTFQLKCECGNVKEVNTHSIVTENDRLCTCGIRISEQNTQEVGKDLLLE